ncbi:glycosyltransferase [Nocardioides sp. YIM 152588]|uniref:glycosyltransferase n=1 Tax=Nocardioides sp. YIM 152588 TaxID=3158259 RepID=UPI0032E3B3A5
MRIEYLTSRFPRTSETFIVRELDALAGLPGVEVGVRSLFPSPDTTVHDVARPWVPRLVRPSRADAARGLAWALATRPLRLLAALAIVVRAHTGSPALLPRALIAFALATSHARQLAGTGAHVHAHYATYPALAAWVCGRLAGTTYSFTAHAHDLYVDASMLHRKVADAEFVVTISEFNRALLDDLGTGTEVDLVHCGVDTAAYPFVPRSIPASGPVRGLCVASLQEYKGHATLLRALAVVDRLHLDLIGDGVLRTDLEKLAAELGVADRVRFLGPRSEAEVREALAAADLFVLPSVVARDGQMEGLPVALMEALASGVPTVSTRLSGIPEIVVDGETGLLAEPADPASLAAALTRILEDAPEVVRARVEAGRALVCRDFELRTEVGRLAGLFHRHLDRS